jgi:hypothetical protein
VYENGRAYPLSIVRYYCGDRDPVRTPMKKKEDLIKKEGETVRDRNYSGTWKFEDDD